MFIQNKYLRWYESIIANAKTKHYEFTECHHILPRSMGGSDDQSNLIELSPREHFICHLLLAKCTTGEARTSMVFAAFMMSKVKNDRQHRDYLINSRIYEGLAKERAKLVSQLKSGRALSEEHKEKISKSLIGRKHSNEAKHRISKNHRRGQSEETSAKISQSKSGIATRGYGWETAEETREKQRLSNLGKTRSKETKEKNRLNKLGRKWVSNPTTNQTKLASPEEISKLINSGWVRGRLRPHQSMLIS